MKPTPTFAGPLFSVAMAAISAAFVACGGGEQSASTPSSTPEATTSAPTGTAAPQTISASEDVTEVPSGSLLFTTTSHMDNLYIVNSDGSGLKRLTSSAGRDELGDFSPDGSLIAYASRDRGDRADGIYVVSNGGGDARLVAADPLWDWDPSWGRKGKILYEEGVQGYGDCWIVNPDGSGHVPISGDEACGGGEWSPDGRTIVVLKCGTWDSDVGTKCSLSLLDDEGNLVRTLVEGVPIRSFDWSPDGSKILFDTGSLPIRISIINSDGTGLHTVQAPPGRVWHTPEWSPDGSQIVLRGDTETALISPTDGSSRTISGVGVLSPDGSEIAMSTSDGIIGVSLDDGSNRVLVSGEHLGGFSWSPDGEKSAYTSQDGLYVVEKDGSETKVVDDPEMDGYTWSPDGTQILFASARGHEGGTWWTSPDGAQTGGSEELSKEEENGLIGGCKEGPDRLSCLSPGGRSEATAGVKDKDKSLTIKDSATGATREINVDNADIRGVPVWSNGGTKIALCAGDFNDVKLYVVDVATGEADEIAADAGPGLTIAWSPDDSYVDYARSTLCVEGCHPGLLYRVHPDGTGDEQVEDMLVDSVYGFKP